MSLVNIRRLGNPKLGSTSRRRHRDAGPAPLRGHRHASRIHPYAALYKYALNSLVASASGYYEALRQLRTLQLKTDKEMQAFAQKAAADIDGAGSMTALLAVQQQLMTDLMERELAYFRDLEK